MHMIQHICVLFAAFAGQPLGPVPRGEVVSPEVATFTPADLSSADDRMHGLIGTASVNGPLANILFTYHPGRLWPENMIPELFYDGEHRPPVTVQLHGYIEIPRDMVMKVWHAGGGVNGDTAELTLGGRSLGIVGDDTLKNVVTTVQLSAGTYDIHWMHTTLGVYRPHYLKFEDAATGESLLVFHLERLIPTVPNLETADRVEVDGDPSEWQVIDDTSQWYAVNLAAVPAPQEPFWTGCWRAEFANGIVQTYLLAKDGTATVDADVWHDTGSIEISDGCLIVRFTEDRTELWTRVGDRMVVEHWFPASHLPTQRPVLGIAERWGTGSSE